MNGDDFNLSDGEELFFSIYRPSKQQQKILCASKQQLFDLFAGRIQLFALFASYLPAIFAGRSQLFALFAIYLPSNRAGYAFLTNSDFLLPAETLMNACIDH